MIWGVKFGDASAYGLSLRLAPSQAKPRTSAISNDRPHVDEKVAKLDTPNHNNLLIILTQWYIINISTPLEVSHMGKNIKHTNIQKHMSIAIALFLIITLIAPISSYAYNQLIREGASPAFEILDRSSGLSNLSVSSIVQDRDGFIWFGTQGGLNRYDGRHFKTYAHDPFNTTGLLHNLIQTLYYDAEAHAIWIGSYQGLSRLDIETDTFMHFTVEKNGLTNPVVVAIEKDAYGDIWAGTLDGLNKIDIETGDLTPYPVAGKVVRDITLDSSGTLWVGTYEGLQVFDYTSNALKKTDYELPSPYVMVVNAFEDDTLSLGLWDGGVVKINVENDTIKKLNFEDNRVYSYIRTTDGTEWVGTWGGGVFAITSDGKRSNYKNRAQQDQLPHDIVYAMFQDDQDILWIGTNGGGIAKVNPLKRNYVSVKHIADDPDSLSSGKINAIAKDASENLWVAVYNEGLNRISPKGVVTKFPAEPNIDGALHDPNVVSIGKDTDGNLLFGAGNKIYQYDEENNRFDAVITYAEGVIIYAIENGVADDLWIGTYNDGVFHCYHDITENLNSVQYCTGGEQLTGLSDNLVYDILLDSKGRLWVATNNGLNLKTSLAEPFKIFKSVPGSRSQLASNTIRALYEDTSGRIWIGLVGGGIAYYNEDDTFTSFVETDGMPSNTVLGILQGDDGRIWASTQNGLAIITPDSNDIFTLSPEEGIGGYEFNAGHYKDSKGIMYFGGIHGITTIPGNISGGVSKPPRVYITDIEINQAPYNLDRSNYNDASLELSYEERLIQFEFVALDYDSPDKTKFSYRLVGYDENWFTAGTANYVNYSKLPPGKYTFEVYAETARGLKSETERISIEIQTPWYFSTWAYLAYLAVALFIIFSLIKMRESKVLADRNQKLADMNNQLELANEKLEALSTIDALTNLYNRRYLDIRLDEELNIAIRSGLSLSILMLDLDNFKKLNDTFGHVLGDQYLIKVGEKIKQALPRATDFGVRYGGDEFMIVLFDTDDKGAMIVAENIRKSIEDITLIDAGQPLDIQTTCSMGLMTLIPKTGMDIIQLTKLADEALYEAKRHGKNTITTKQFIN